MKALLAASMLALAACGEGGGVILDGPGDDDDDPPPASTCTATTCGEVVIGLTDADGDFLNYAVDVVSLKLERSNGSVVETLPVRQRVDFAELVDVTELVTSATIPNGDYVSATIRLDYEDAEVSVEVDGAPAQALVVDENGDELGVVDVELTLDTANHVVIAPGTPALLQLDFDLAASHAVNISTTPAVAVAAPFLVASIEPVDVKDFRVRGPLVSVDETAGNYVIEIRPFNHATAELGEFTIETTTGTAFEIDGDELTGVAGLAALADKPGDTPTVAQGVYDTTTREFTADRVLAGTSVPGIAFDAVIGNVVSRAGNELTVRGATVVLQDDRVVFVRPDIKVLIGAGTAVTQFGSGGSALDIDSISVGQRIHAFGDASGTVSASVPDLELDATAGRVRLHVTHVLGTVVDAIAGQLTLDLFSIDGRDAEFFDFSGTGGSIITDADPENYQIDTDNLDVSAFEPDEPARVFGFVAPFGAAPPDFSGRTLVNFDELRALLGVGWGFDGTDEPFMSMGSSGFVIDTTNTDLGDRRFIKIGPRIVDITTLASPMTIEPDTEGRTAYAISRGLRVEMFRDFAPFSERVSRLLGGGSTLQALTARGSFDTPSTTLTANYVAVAFKAP